MDFLLTAPRATEAALRLLKTARRRPGLPETLTIDGSDAQAAAITSDNEEHGTALILRPVQARKNGLEQDQRAVKRGPRPLLGLKAFVAAQDTLVGIELMPMIPQRQLVVAEGDEGRTAAALFYSLAAESLSQPGATALSRPPEQNLRHNPSKPIRIGAGLFH